MLFCDSGGNVQMFSPWWHHTGQSCIF